MTVLQLRKWEGSFCLEMQELARRGARRGKLGTRGAGVGRRFGSCTFLTPAIIDALETHDGFGGCQKRVWLQMDEENLPQPAVTIPLELVAYLLPVDVNRYTNRLSPQKGTCFVKAASFRWALVSLVGLTDSSDAGLRYSEPGPVASHVTLKNTSSPTSNTGFRRQLGTQQTAQRHTVSTR